MVSTNGTAQRTNDDMTRKVMSRVLGSYEELRVQERRDVFKRHDNQLLSMGMNSRSPVSLLSNEPMFEQRE